MKEQNCEYKHKSGLCLHPCDVAYRHDNDENFDYGWWTMCKNKDCEYEDIIMPDGHTNFICVEK